MPKIASTKKKKSVKTPKARHSARASGTIKTRAAGKRKSPGSGGSKPLDLSYFRQLLRKERDRLTEERERIRARSQQAEGTVPADENWEADEDSGDISSSMYEKEINVSLESELEELLERVDTALQRIADKTYGTCDMCGQAIARLRLERIPYATLCVQCQSMVEQM